jgi:hypothetical protein
MKITPNKKVEKRYVVSPDKFSLIDFTDMGVVEEDKSKMPRFVIGENYALGGECVEGFTQKCKLYNLVGIVDEFAGTKIDALIVKQIDGEKGNIYTISKSDCNFLGIEYQNGLQLFSKNLDWRHIRNIPEFNPHNLGTSPSSEIDNTIRYLVLKLDGFKDYSDGYVLTPSGKLIKESQFTQTIQVISKEPVVYGNGHIIQDKKPLKVSVTHPTTKLFNHGNFISSEDEVFVLIDFMESAYYAMPSNGNTSFDGCFGVIPKYFEGIDPNEYFEISWDELGGMTIEEYEEAKRKVKEESERRAKEREERERRLKEEAEKAAEEEARIRDLMIERMKMYKIRETKIDNIVAPTFNNEINRIVGIDQYLNNVSSYFEDLDNALNDISNDLSKLNRNVFKVNGRRLNRIEGNEIFNLLSRII